MKKNAEEKREREGADDSFHYNAFVSGIFDATSLKLVG
jgi:hypothetical protein